MFSVYSESVAWGVLEPQKSLREGYNQGVALSVGSILSHSQPWVSQWGHGNDAEGRTPPCWKQCGPRSTTSREMVGAAAWSRTRPSPSFVQLWWERNDPGSLICLAASPRHSHPWLLPFCLDSDPWQANREPPDLDR